MTPFARATRGRSSLSSLKSRWWGRMSLRRSVGIRVVGIREGLGLRVLGFPRQGRLRCTAPGAKLALIHGGLTLFRRRTGKGRGNGRTGGARVLPHDASDCCHTGFFVTLPVRMWRVLPPSSPRRPRALPQGGRRTARSRAGSRPLPTPPTPSSATGLGLGVRVTGYGWH